ncbi:unnamed protein product [Brassicogethes aeneus]|uniref:Anticodon-binding domain-containing protein n=1 Tax=Brassicogethes aeneus TaxID=1431903 RepID=A0A9P0FQI6_BRAAE|nr:unnamed protein product [Brassicogethes aeneus]
MNKILTLCENRGFLQKTYNAALKQDIITIFPTGALLQANLRNEWFNSSIINKDHTVFLNKNDFDETVEYARNLCNVLPFGVADVLRNKKSMKERVDLVKESGNKFDFRMYTLENDYNLKTNFYVSPKTSTHFFHQFQKQRKMWWRKFSANPGRYCYSDIKNGDKGTQRIDIIAEYEWGKQILETLTLNNDGRKKKNLEFKEGKTTFYPDIISSDISTTAMFLNALCDSYEEPVSQGKPRPLLHFHRKLAPYKLSFAITSQKASTLSELCDLALFLCRQLRDNHVSTLMLPSCSKLKLEEQWQQYDQMGIPYNIILNDNTLKDGVTLLRSRDTTLKEQVHVSDIVDYVEKLFKNY